MSITVVNRITLLAGTVLSPLCVLLARCQRCSVPGPLRLHHPILHPPKSLTPRARGRGPSYKPFSSPSLPSPSSPHVSFTTSPPSLSVPTSPSFLFFLHVVPTAPHSFTNYKKTKLRSL